MIKRREFISLLSGAATWPLAARAQQSAMPVVGFLNVASPNGFEPMVAAFRQRLKEAGYVEGHNVAIEYRWASGYVDALAAMAADLVQRQVAVIAATGTPSSLAAKAATTSIPIVFELSTDPVQLGLVASLSRPGGNITGVTQLNTELAPKELELLHEVLPAVTVLALLVNRADPVLLETNLRVMTSAAHTLGLELHVIDADSEREFDAAFNNVVQLRAGGFVIAPDFLFSGHTQQLAALAARHRVPAIYKGREFAAAGGLISYGSDIKESYRLAGIYTGRILKGEKPADLPVQQSSCSST